MMTGYGPTLQAEDKMAAKVASRLPKRVWDPHQVFDVTVKEQRAIAERVKIRQDLKKEWQMKVSHPYNNSKSYVFDPAMQRYLAMRVTHWEHFKPSHRNFLWTFCWIYGPIIGLTYYYITSKRKEDQTYRAGLVAYEDRMYKFR